MVDYKKPVLSLVKRNGLVCENESMFYKIKALINCPKYEAFQPEFYDLDPDNINPELEEKINKMYRKAIASGDITGTDDDEEYVMEDEDELGYEDDETFGHDDENDEWDGDRDNRGFNPAYSINAQPVGDMPISDIPASGPVVNTFTCLYSALDKDGTYKTGKFYSNASSSDTARIDAVSKLAGFGYKNIEIVAVETGSVTPAQMSNNDTGDEIEQMPPEEQASSETDNMDEAPSTMPEDLTNDEKLQMFNDWFTAFKSTLYDMDVDSLTILNDEQKQEFWTRLKTKTIEMPQDPRTFISKATMDKLENGTFPKNVQAENPVATGETADDDAEVQAALGTGDNKGKEEEAPAEEPAPEGNEGPGDTGNAPVFNNTEAPAAEQPADTTTTAEQPAETPEQNNGGGGEETVEEPAPVGNEENDEEGEEEVVTEEDETPGWGDDAWENDNDFSFLDYLKDIPIDDEPLNGVENNSENEFDDEYELPDELPDEEPIFQDEMPRRCFYNVVREKNPYHGDGPFAD